MKLNKPVITICLIILLVINLIFFSFLSIGKKASNKDYIQKIVNRFDFKEYLLNNKNIDKSINEFKYSKEVFDYLDNIKIDELKNKIVNNLFDNEKYIISKDDVSSILDNSVLEFEINRSKDIRKYVQQDIEEFSNIFETRVNKELSSGFHNINNFVSVFYPISILLSLALFTMIIIYEKNNGILISSIALIVYSFFVFYLNKYFIKNNFNYLLKYFKSIDLELDNLYIVCFILGFVLLLIYIVKLLKKVARDIRIRSYNSMVL